MFAQDDNSKLSSFLPSAPVVIGLVVVIVGLSGLYFLNSGSADFEDKTSLPAYDKPTEERVLNGAGSGAPVEDTKSDKSQKSGKYTSFSSQNLAEAQKQGKTVLFFHADWCPTCRAADADITKKLSSIPEGVTILKTDYDSEKELKKKHGVVNQHTFVILNQDGEAESKWNGGSLAEIVRRI